MKLFESTNSFEGCKKNESNEEGQMESLDCLEVIEDIARPSGEISYKTRDLMKIYGNEVAITVEGIVDLEYLGNDLLLNAVKELLRVVDISELNENTKLSLMADVGDVLKSCNKILSNY